MKFSNINAYRIDPIDVEAFQEHLESKAFQPIRDKQHETQGFAQIFGLEQRVFEQNKCFLFCLRTETRRADPGAVKTELDKRIQILKLERGGEKIKSSERRDIKEEITKRLTDQAAPRAKDLWAYIDNINKLLIIDTGSAKNADVMVSAIRDGMSSNVIYPMRPQHNVKTCITTWMQHAQMPKDLLFGDSCILERDGSQIKYNKNDLDDERLREYLTEGYVISQIKLQHDKKVDFSLTEDFVFKGFKLTDAAFEDHDAGTGEPLELLAADMILISKYVSELLTTMVENLGGELEH
ncbi:recombination associated protein RdgC [Pseudomonas nitritireducens]|uniref:Recombination-associated protein RdgC n=1 Tax=Pseudomonas nitroreducens TaxID=46680 RepID=A0A7W7KFJ2_PSENT|nr:recombination-associated protein RdgC [Pseudomonas nitritireducens]MBB4861343.1 recombination associated protein RdgC [Pseudomonas nitritireducens]